MSSRAQPIYAKYVAVNVTTGLYVSGDLANHTLFWVKDGTGATPTNAPTEPNSKGTYQVLLTGTEATCNDGQIIGSTTTANVVLIGVAYTFEQLPTAVPGAQGGVTIIDDSLIGVVQASPSPTTTTFTGGGTLVASGTNNYQNCLIVFKGGAANAYAPARRIASSSGAAITLGTALPTAPVAGDIFEIIGYVGN